MTALLQVFFCLVATAAIAGLVLTVRQFGGAALAIGSQLDMCLAGQEPVFARTRSRSHRRPMRPEWRPAARTGAAIRASMRKASNPAAGRGLNRLAKVRNPGPVMGQAPDSLAVE